MALDCAQPDRLTGRDSGTDSSRRVCAWLVRVGRSQARARRQHHVTSYNDNALRGLSQGRTLPRFNRKQNPYPSEEMSANRRIPRLAYLNQLFLLIFRLLQTPRFPPKALDLENPALPPVYFPDIIVQLRVHAYIFLIPNHGRDIRSRSGNVVDECASAGGARDVGGCAHGHGDSGGRVIEHVMTQDV